MKISTAADVAAVLLSFGFVFFFSGQTDAVSADPASPPVMGAQAEALEKLKALEQPLDDGGFTQQEYEEKRASLISNL